MNHKKSLENSAYEESDNDFSNYSTDIETFTEKNSTKKNTMDEIIELKKQLKYLKEKASKDNDERKKQNKKQKKIEAAKQSDHKKTKPSSITETLKNKANKKKIIIPREESTEWSSTDPEQPIPKYKGYNYIKKRTWNGYMEAMRHICKEYLSEVANTTMYKDIDAGLLNKVVDKVSKR
ncbi:hypothetical protein RclHR1_00390028 [Rhizophagus clarus]|uniref:Uncharacterized protein n=1 Tax=Rhizophagus clarus TaxID=94130 RepID=A0A2Z6RES8_9GLOM|nr:hypothetical protein RclHR1_00390028 [Rhizophagus clarus]